MAQEQPTLRRFHGMAIMSDALAMWRLGCDARRLSVGDAPGEAYLRIRPALYYWSRATTTATTRAWIAGKECQRAFAGDSHWPMTDRPAETADDIALFFKSL